MMRVRVSHLEAYRRLVAEEYGDSADDLILDVQAWQKGWERSARNWKMDAGTAWHACLSNHPDAMCYGPEWGYGNYRFRSEDVYAAQAHQGPGFREVTARRVFETRRGPVEVKATCDHLWGRTVRDAKTKFGTPDAGAYDLSLQWRFYLLLFHADAFVYDLFAMRDPDDAGLCVLRETVSFRLWRYPDLERECRSWLERFVDWADSHDLLSRTAAGATA